MANTGTAPAGRITQRDIARLAGVSQTTVSLVLNNNTEASARIAPETRERVLQVIRETGYVADPLARRMLRQHNQILGVFTYEPVFPSGSADFYHPFLTGIEACAERLGCDLLLFTSAPVTGGQRRVFHENNRLRLADGCLLLGRAIPGEELARLVDEQYPFVSVGRRDGPVPYVGADYATATATLAGRAVALGHRRTAYVGPGTGVESSVDRLAGFRRAVPDGLHLPTADHAVLDTLLAAGVTVAFCEEMADAVALDRAARERGLRVPEALSLVALGDPTRPTTVDREFAGFHVPRREMGWQAVETLIDTLHGPGAVRQRLLPCEVVEGTTLAAPKEGTA